MAFVGRNRWSRRTSFWFVVAAQVLLFAGSNFPTPLFPIYEDRYGFGSGTVTLLFGVYVLVLVPTLVLLGPVADRFGRRPQLRGLRAGPRGGLAVRGRDHLRSRRRNGDGLRGRRHP
jgi:MFS family permease